MYQDIGALSAERCASRDVHVVSRLQLRGTAAVTTKMRPLLRAATSANRFKRLSKYLPVVGEAFLESGESCLVDLPPINVYSCRIQEPLLLHLAKVSKELLESGRADCVCHQRSNVRSQPRAPEGLRKARRSRARRPGLRC